MVMNSYWENDRENYKKYKSLNEIVIIAIK